MLGVRCVLNAHYRPLPSLQSLRKNPRVRSHIYAGARGVVARQTMNQKKENADRKQRGLLHPEPNPSRNAAGKIELQSHNGRTELPFHVSLLPLTSRTSRPAA